MDEKFFRLLDANLNRAREGLRVLEDTARFVWEDKGWFKNFRSLRHRLDKITRAHYPSLLACRDSSEDEGRTIEEGAREKLQSIVAANFRRCEESLRVLEEYGKLLSRRTADEFKKMRFTMYGHEKKILGRFFK